MQKIVLYPDPVASLSPVTVHGLPPGHTWEVRMSDMNGRAVFNTSMRSDNSLFVLPAMATGLYAVLLRAAGIEHRLRLCVAAQP
ncbi:MAG: T9SS type A sorting domain-containing protein [Flavobacteriales bacterium]|nr:T9SS type A sorting domain-containing protein [Flavobacteriales bacterium]